MKNPKQLSLFDLLEQQNLDFTPDPFGQSSEYERELAENLARKASTKSDAVQQSILKQLDASGLAKDASSKIPLLEKQRAIEALKQSNKIPMRSDTAFEMVGKPFNPNAHFETVGEAFNPDQLPVKAKNLLPDVITTAEKPSVLKGLLKKYGPNALNMLGKTAKFAGIAGDVYAAVDPTELDNPSEGSLEGFGTEEPENLQRSVDAMDIAQTTPIPGLDDAMQQEIPYAPGESSQQIPLSPDQKQEVPSPEEITKLQAQSQQGDMSAKKKLLDMLFNSQNTESEKALLRNMTRAFQQVGAGLGGTKFDPSGIDALEKSNIDQVKLTKDQIEMQELEKEQQVKDASRDPASSISIQAREMYTKLTGKDLPPNVSAEALQKAGLPLGNLVSMQSAQQSKKEIKELELEQKKASSIEKLDKEKRTFVNGLRKELSTGELGKSQTLLYTANKMKDSLTEFSDNPNAYSDYATLMGSLKTLQGDTSVVREAEVRMGKNATSLINASMNYIQELANGKSLQPSQRRDMINTIKTFADAAKSTYVQRITPIIKHAQKEEVDLDLLLPQGISAEDFKSKSSGESPSEKGYDKYAPFIARVRTKYPDISDDDAIKLLKKAGHIK